LDTLTWPLFCIFKLGKGIITTVLRIQDGILYKLNKGLPIRTINTHRSLPIFPDIPGYILKAGSTIYNFYYICSPDNPAVFIPLQLCLVEEVLGFFDTLPLVSWQFSGFWSPANQTYYRWRNRFYNRYPNILKTTNLSFQLLQVLPLLHLRFQLSNTTTSRRQFLCYYHPTSWFWGHLSSTSFS
jgi:hypothetical protein